MIPKAFNDIGPADIQALLDNQVPESRTLDYKAELVGTKDSDRLEFVKDVSAFANAEGGDIVFGIGEQKDENGNNTGFPGPITGLQKYNHDQETLRLESILISGCKPRLSGLRFRHVVTPHGSVLVTRVERGFSGPHMVVTQEHNRFWGRHSRGKYMLDVDELRRLFLRTAELPERLRQLRAERLKAISTGQTPFILQNNPKLILRVVPFRAFDTGTSIDLQTIHTNSANLLPFGRGGDTRFNLDGHVVFTGDGESGRTNAYTQVFRTGMIEVVDSTTLSSGSSNAKLLPAPAITQYVLESVGDYVSVLDKAGAGPPYVMLLDVSVHG